MNDHDLVLIVKTLEHYTQLCSEEFTVQIVHIASFINNNHFIKAEDIPTVKKILSEVKDVYNQWIEKTNSPEYPDRETFQNFYREKIRSIENVLSKL